MIDETRYIVILQALNKNGFKTYHIDEFEKLILHMRSIGMNNGFVISLTIHLRDLAYRKLLDTARLSDDIGLILGRKKIHMASRIDSIKKYLEHSKTLIRSFEKIETLQCQPNQPYQPYQPYQLCRPNYLINRPDTAWHYQMRRDIIRRLYLLSHKHFTLVQLQHMGVVPRLASELTRIPYPMLVSYYLDTVRKISVAVDVLVDVCELYIEIDASYAISCGQLIQGFPAVIVLKQFQICYPILSGVLSRVLSGVLPSVLPSVLPMVSPSVLPMVSPSVLPMASPSVLPMVSPRISPRAPQIIPQKIDI